MSKMRGGVIDIQQGKLSWFSIAFQMNIVSQQYGL